MNEPPETEPSGDPNAPSPPPKRKRGRRRKTTSEQPAAPRKGPPLNRKKGLTYEDRVAIVRRRENRETMVTIAADYGVSRQNIAQIIDLYRKHGLEGLRSRPTGRRRMSRLSKEQIERLREIIATHARPSDRGVSMSRLKNVWYAESLRKLISREFRLKIPQMHCKEICRELGIPQSINMGLLNPVRIAENRENLPGYAKDPADGGAPVEAGPVEDEEICGDLDAIRKKLSEHRLKTATAEIAAKRTRAAAKKGFRQAPRKKGKAKVRHSRKKRR